jgi:hypothetical protein
MECLDNRKIHLFVEKGFTSVEQSIIRDHLIVCEKCRLQYEQYIKLEKYLNEPEYIEPPKVIEKYVLKKIYSKLPTYSSILTLIAASFIFLVSWIYIYFDFANNSILKAFHLTFNNTSNLFSSVIKTISSIFSSVYAVFKAINKFIAIIFDVHMGVEVISLSVLVLTILIIYAILQIVSRRSKRQDI